MNIHLAVARITLLLQTRDINNKPYKSAPYSGNKTQLQHYKWKTQELQLEELLLEDPYLKQEATLPRALCQALSYSEKNFIRLKGWMEVHLFKHGTD